MAAEFNTRAAELNGLQAVLGPIIAGLTTGAPDCWPAIRQAVNAIRNAANRAVNDSWNVVDERDAQVRALTTQLDNCLSGSYYRQTEFQACTRELAAAQGDQAASTRLIAQLRRQIAELQQSNRNQAANLARCNETLSTTKSQLRLAQESTSALQTQLRNSQAQYTNCHNSLTTAQRAIQACNNQVTVLQRQNQNCAELRQQNSTLQIQLNECIRSYNGVSNELYQTQLRLATCTQNKDCKQCTTITGKPGKCSGVCSEVRN